MLGICDTGPERLQAAADKTGAPSQPSLAELLLKPNAKLIALSTPSGLLPTQAAQIAATERHVVSEEPMATHWQDGIRLVDACDKAGVRLFVVQKNRRIQTLQMLKNAIRQRRFGRIYHGQHQCVLDPAAGVLRHGHLSRRLGIRQRRADEPS